MLRLSIKEESMTKRKADEAVIPEVENPAVDVSVEPIAPPVEMTEGEVLRDDEAPETAAALDAVGEHLMNTGHGEGGLPLAAAVVETALAAPVAARDTRVNFKAHPPVATEEEAVKLCEKMPEGSFFKQVGLSYRVYEALHGA